MGKYDSKPRYGYVLLGPDGEPAARIWAHSDDFLLQSAFETTAKAFTFFLGTAVEFGLLCHPGKLTPPSQVVQYCGFMLDLIGIPTMRIPFGKQERAIAKVDYFLLRKATTEFSIELVCCCQCPRVSGGSYSVASLTYIPSSNALACSSGRCRHGR
jgi:hypothetical protein